jgi:hypothetical protein
MTPLLGITTTLSTVIGLVLVAAPAAHAEAWDPSPANQQLLADCLAVPGNVAVGSQTDGNDRICVGFPTDRNGVGIVPGSPGDDTYLLAYEPQDWEDARGTLITNAIGAIRIQGADGGSDTVSLELWGQGWSDSNLASHTDWHTVWNGGGMVWSLFGSVIGSDTDNPENLTYTNFADTIGAEVDGQCRDYPDITAGLIKFLDGNDTSKCVSVAQEMGAGDDYVLQDSSPAPIDLGDGADVAITAELGQTTAAASTAESQAVQGGAGFDRATIDLNDATEAVEKVTVVGAVVRPPVIRSAKRVSRHRAVVRWVSRDEGRVVLKCGTRRKVVSSSPSRTRVPLRSVACRMKVASSVWSAPVRIPRWHR